MISKRTKNKYKILKTLKNTELSIEDIEMYTGLNRLNIVPLIQDLKRWKDIEKTATETHHYTKHKRNIYTLTEKGEKKLKHIKIKYNID